MVSFPESRIGHPNGVRQREGHQRVQFDRPEAETDLHRWKSFEEAPQPSHDPNGRLRRSLSRANGPRGLPSSAGQRPDGHPSRILRPARSKRIVPPAKVSDATAAPLWFSIS